VGGLILMLGALACFLWRTRRRDQSGGSGRLDREKGPSAHPLLTTSTPQDERTPAQLFSVLPSGETQLSALPSQVIPRGILAEEEKARRGPAQPMGPRQQDISELTELQRLAEATLASSTSQADSTNAQLLDELRVLRDQMHAIEQRIQITVEPTVPENPPEYTAKPS